VYIFTPGSGPDGGYKTYWLFDNSEGAEFNRKWVDGYQVAKEVIMPGQGFWVRNRSTTTNYYTHLGEAELDDTVTMTIQPGLQILAYPYSCDVEIGKLACTNGVANSNSALADNIYVYTPGVGYRTYWLFDDAEGPAYYRKWVDGAQVATDVIKAGQGFWYRSRSTGNVTWIEKRPYLND